MNQYIPSDEPRLLTVSQVAELAGAKSLSVVSNWKKRRHDFPQPKVSVAGGELYDEIEIVEWLTANGKIDRRRDTVSEAVWRVLDAMRGAYSIDVAIEMALAIICLSALLTDEERIELQRSSPNTAPALLLSIATACEARGEIAPGALTGPLSPAAQGGAVPVRSLLELLGDTGSAESAFEELLRTSTRRLGRSVAESRSTEELAAFVAALIPGSPTSVLDPAVGWGTLLLTALGKLPNRPKVFAQDVNAASWAVTNQRLALHAIAADVHRGDSLVDDEFRGVRTDLVIVDPPYGIKLSPAAQEAWHLNSPFGGIHPRLGDLVWLDYALRHLTPRGLAFVVLPAGSLFRGGAEGAIRAEVLRRGSVSAVIALPPGMAASTHIQLAVWILRNPAAASDESGVLLIDASGRDPSTSKARASERKLLLDNAVREFSRWRSNPSTYSPVSGVSAVVPILDLLGRDVPLTPGFWTDQSKTADTESLAETANSTLRVFHEIASSPPPRLSEELAVEAGNTEAPTLVPLQTLADTGRLSYWRGVRLDRNTLHDSGAIGVLTPASIGDNSSEPSAAGYIASRPTAAETTEPGDVVFLPQGRIRAVVDTRGGHVLAAPLIGIRPRSTEPALRPRVLAALLSDSRMATLAAGTTIPSIHVKQVTIPILPEDTARQADAALGALAEARLHAIRVAVAAEAAKQAVVTAVCAGASVRGAVADSHGDRRANKGGSTQ